MFIPCVFRATPQLSLDVMLEFWYCAIMNSMGSTGVLNCCLTPLMCIHLCGSGSFCTMPCGTTCRSASPFHAVRARTHVNHRLKSPEEVIWKELGGPYYSRNRGK